MKSNPLFTPSELEELRRFDAQVDAEPIPDSDLRAADERDIRIIREREGNVSPQTRWNRKNPERKREANRKWRLENHERQLEASRSWVEAHKESVREYKRQWYQVNKAACNEKNRQYRARKREERKCAQNAVEPSGT